MCSPTRPYHLLGHQVFTVSIRCRAPGRPSHTISPSEAKRLLGVTVCMSHLRNVTRKGDEWSRETLKAMAFTWFYGI